MAEAQTVTVETPAPVETPPEPPRIQVVTPENFDAYVNEKLGVAETPEEMEEELKAEDAAKQEKADSQKQEKVDAKAEDKPKKGKNHELNQRFSELTEARKAAEKKAEELAAKHKAEREAREKAEADAKALREKYEPPKSDEIGPEPLPSQFTDVNEYSKALKDWTAENVRREDARKAAEERAAQERAKIAQDWQKRQTEAKASIEDYEKVISESDVKVSNEVRDAILESDVGPQLLYHLAKNPEVAEKIGSMTVGRALKELGRLEVKLSGGTAESGPKSEKTERNAVAEISKAPPPISPLKAGAGEMMPRVDGDGNFHGTYEEWKALRKAGKIR